MYLFQLEVNPLKENIIHEFFKPSQEEQNAAFLESRPVRRPKKLEFDTFVRTFAVFRPIHKAEKGDPEQPNSLENKVKFLFDMFDADKSGHVHKAEVLAVLERMVGAQVE